jgi:nitrite reductase/ring-hydroxylating ferredoxin subunit
MKPVAWTSLCTIDELEEGKGKYVEIGGFALAVFLSGGEVSVIDNTCPHSGGNLSAGHVDDGCAVCPWHQWAFRLDNGELRGSGGVAVSRYPCRLFEYQGKKLVQAQLPIF